MEHLLTLADRRHLTLSGAEDVIRFDETAIVLKTVCGLLSIEGEGLHIVKMSVETGDLIIEGTVDALLYQQSSESEKRSFFSRLFH